MKNQLLPLLLILLVSCQPHIAIVAAVVTNGGFEEGWHLATTYWTPDGGPFHNQFVEITPPKDWTAWWYEGFPCSGTPNHAQRRPEVRVISTIPDPTRIHSGDQAAKFFTFWGCHRGGLYQQVAVEPGKHYTAQVFAHSWFSECSTKPHSAPYEKDCSTPITWAQLRLRICVDPLGGTNPAECSPWEQIYGGYDDPLVVRHVEAIGSTMTIILESVASHPLKHDDVYWDDVSISESYQVFLPVVAKEG